PPNDRSLSFLHASADPGQSERLLGLDHDAVFALVPLAGFADGLTQSIERGAGGGDLLGRGRGADGWEKCRIVGHWHATQIFCWDGWRNTEPAGHVFMANRTAPAWGMFLATDGG